MPTGTYNKNNTRMAWLHSHDSMVSEIITQDTQDCVTAARLRYAALMMQYVLHLLLCISGQALPEMKNVTFVRDKKP